jgi:hypothetical protein
MSNEIEFEGRTVLTTDAAVSAKLWTLYETRKPGRRLPLFCTKSHRGQMYLWQRRSDGSLWASHYPGQGGGCNTRIPGREGLEHLHFKDYTLCCADDSGFAAELEYSLGYRQPRLDVAVHAPTRFAAEVQFSDIDTRDAKARTTQAMRHGWPRIWLPGIRAVGEKLAGQVPVLRHNDTEIDWQLSPAKGTVAALGIRRITAEQCTPSSRWQVCPVGRQKFGKGTFCRHWHPWLNDVATGWTVDDAIAGIGGGGLSILQTITGMVLLVVADDVARYQELSGHDGVFNPGVQSRRVVVVSDPSEPRPCTASRSFELAELVSGFSKERNWLPMPPRSEFGDIEWIKCQVCGGEACHPDSVASGVCQGCTLRLKARDRDCGQPVDSRSRGDPIPPPRRLKEHGTTRARQTAPCGDRIPKS